MNGTIQLKRKKYYIVLDGKVDGKRVLKWISTNFTQGDDIEPLEDVLKYMSILNIPFSNCVAAASSAVSKVYPVKKVATEQLNVPVGSTPALENAPVTPSLQPLGCAEASMGSPLVYVNPTSYVDRVQSDAFAGAVPASLIQSPSVLYPKDVSAPDVANMSALPTIQPLHYAEANISPYPVYVNPTPYMNMVPFNASVGAVPASLIQPPSNLYLKDISVSEAVINWLVCAQRRVDPVTYNAYAYTAKSHIISYFSSSGITVRQCSTEVLQVFFDEKFKNGRLDGKGGLSPKTIRSLYNILRQSFEKAVDDKIIALNPCDKVELPRKVRFKPKFYSAEQLNALFAAFESDPLLPLIRITAIYGLRRSEVLGLKWDSLNFSARIVTIQHVVCRQIVKVAKDRTKTESSHRSYPMTDSAYQIFMDLKKEESTNRSEFGAKYTSNDYIFKWPDGRPFDPDYVSHHFGKMLKKHNLPHIRFHELRHSSASVLLNNGCGLKDVQEWLGHSDIQTTANIYGHLDMSRKKELANRMSDCLSELQRSC